MQHEFKENVVHLGVEQRDEGEGVKNRLEGRDAMNEGARELL